MILVYVLFKNISNFSSIDLDVVLLLTFQLSSKKAARAAIMVAANVVAPRMS